MEGDALPPRTVVLEFPSVEAAKAWYNSPEYQEIIGIRHANATGFAAFAADIVKKWPGRVVLGSDISRFDSNRKPISTVSF